MKAPIVSVIIPTHNRGKFLGAAIRSVLAQTEKNIEVIVVDDASIDDTGVLLKQFASSGDPRIRVLRNSRALGGAGARNVGIGAATGEWIAFLDDDDEWHTNKIRAQVDRLSANPSAVACSCGFAQNFSNGKLRVVSPPENITLRQILKSNYLGGASMCLCSRKVLMRIGGFDTKFRSGQDWDLWVRLRQEGQIEVCQERLVEYRVHDDVRISNNMDAQYMGAKRFYFKYRMKMDVSLKRYNISYICFIMSRQGKRRLMSRLRYLILSLRYVEYHVGLSYMMSSLPRMIRNF